MSTRMIKIVACDFCRTERQVDSKVVAFKMPRGWDIVRDYYGNETHVCGDVECVRKFNEAIAEHGELMSAER